MTRIMTLILFTLQPLLASFVYIENALEPYFRCRISPYFIFDANTRSI